MITDEMRLDFIEDQVRKSPTGVTFQKIPLIDGVRGGIRFMRFHDIHDMYGDLRTSIDQAMRKVRGDDWYQKEQE